MANSWDYRWSSSRVHAGEAGGNAPLAVNTRKFAMDNRQWKEYLKAEDKSVVDELRLKTQRGAGSGKQRFCKAA